ncbi:MAG TPA: alpha/beta hydrolase [Candidatus Binatia bacterium]|jgi:pimeloyl-ACP methyl ester carboxylesterase|nr:alpha/beta hydrolase [Candidatus Binatia bacterium]
MIRRLLGLLALLTCLVPAPATAGSKDVWDRVRHGYADNDGTTIHYATLGRRGPLIVMIHGFPDFWYTWRDQMDALSRRYRVVAIDQRGYNESAQPTDVAQYDITLLASDVAAVIRDVGEEQAVVVGHDWGGAVAWTFAMLYPAMTERLVILNTPHPRGLLRELRENPVQQANSAYARAFQQEGSHLGLTAAGLAGWVTDPVARAHYVEAFERSSFEGMVAYYKRNYPREPYADVAFPLVQAPVLAMHGLGDPFLLAAGWNDTWNFVASGFTLVTVPGAGHFLQQDASATVTKTLKSWLVSEGIR